MEIGAKGRRTRGRYFVEDHGTTSMAVKRPRIHDDHKDEKPVASSPEIGFSEDLVSRNNNVQEPEISTERRLRFLDINQCERRSSSNRDRCLDSACCCSSNRSSENENESVGIVVRQEVNSDVDKPAYFSCDDRETSSHKEDSDGVDSKSKGSDAAEESSAGDHRRRSISETKNLTESEVEDFFSAAEKELQNKLSEYTKKYNFDFAKEEPLGGRYEWIRLKN